MIALRLTPTEAKLLLALLDEAHKGKVFALGRTEKAQVIRMFLATSDVVRDSRREVAKAGAA